MNLDDLVVFVRVAQAGSFTRAAALLGLPKSTVSRRVAALERRLGTSLMHRTTRSLALTDSGRAYLRHGERALAEAEAAERAVGHLRGTPRGLLRVAVPANLGGLLGPPIAEFLRTWPEVELDVVCGNLPVDLIGDGFDLAIRLGSVADAGLVARRLCWAPSMLVASPEYLERRPPPASPEALAEHPCLAIGSGPYYRSLQLRSGRRTVAVAIRGPLKVNDFEMLRETALAGVAIVLMPAWRSAADVEAGRLRQVLADWHTPVVPMHLVFRKARTLPPSARAFVDLLSARIAEHPPLGLLGAAGRTSTAMPAV